jgi:hypothetical protein
MNSAPRLYGVWDSASSFFTTAALRPQMVACSQPHKRMPPGSEANSVIRLFERLDSQQQQDLLNFLRSL